tara:strand:- start:463 stop:1233 length:771 start_codon:yes stop_codon:yes gene_type:complete
MTNRIKDKYGYRLEYNIKLNRGKTFKATDELKRYISKKNMIEGMLQQVGENEENVEELSNKLQRITIKIKNKNAELEELRIEKTQLDKDKLLYDNGDMDEGFDNDMKQKKEKKEENKLMKKIHREKINSENKTLSQEYYEKNRQVSRQDRFKAKNMVYDYKYFIDRGNTLPQVYRNKLKYMTNNNGYLWKRIYFYGKLPVKDDDNTRTIYELFREKIIIHKRNQNGKWSTETQMKKKYIKKENKNFKYSRNHNFSF